MDSGAAPPIESATALQHGAILYYDAFTGKIRGTTQAAASSPYPLIEQAGATRQIVCNNGVVAGYSESYVQPKQIIDNTAVDGLYYLQFTGTGSTGFGMCLASAATPAGPFTSGQLALAGASLNWIIRDQGAGVWYAFCGQGSNKVARYKNTGTLAGGTWNLDASIVLSHSSTATDWDSFEVKECFVMADPRPGHSGYLMFYMGMSSTDLTIGGVATLSEQIGLATAATLNAASWTKVASIATPPSPQTAGSGLILAASGDGSSYNGAEVSEPYVLYINGLFYLFASNVGSNDSGAFVYIALYTAADPINGPWTPHGVCLLPQPWPAGDASCVNSCSFYFHTDGNIYFTYDGGKYSRAASVSTGQAWQTLIDPASFIGPPKTAPWGWERIEAEAVDARISKTGAWTTFTAQQGDSGPTAAEVDSSSIGDSISFTFTGSRVRACCLASFSSGTVQVALDGVDQGSPVDLYQADTHHSITASTRCTVYDSGDISPGSHTLKLTLAGANVAVGSPILAVDYFDFLPTA